MPTHITVNSLGLTHKSSTGMSKATIPDVCKTPSPGGPIPLPYPNFAMSSTLSGGTTTVFAKGGAMIANKPSQYSMSTGDEPGTVGGVKSSTFKQATDWILYSFDVKMDGENACRHTDKKYHNNKNTVDLQGNANPEPAPALDLKKIAEDCNDKVNKPFCDKGKGPSGKKCTALGTEKHKCCEDAINDHNAKNPNASPKVESEVPFASDGGRPPTYTRQSSAQESFARTLAAAASSAGGSWPTTYFMNGGAAFKADVIIQSSPPQPIDFKFNCEPSQPLYKIGPKKGTPKPLSRFMSQKQKDKYARAIPGKEPKIIHVDGGACGAKAVSS